MMGIALNFARTQLDQTYMDLGRLSLPTAFYRIIMMSNWHAIDQSQRDNLRWTLVEALHRFIEPSQSTISYFHQCIDKCTDGIPQIAWTEGTKFQCGQSDLTEVDDISLRHGILVGANCMKFSKDLGEYLSQYYFRLERNAHTSSKVRCITGKDLEDCDGDHYFGHYLLDRIPPVIVVHFAEDYVVDRDEASARRYLDQWTMAASNQIDASHLLFTPVVVIESHGQHLTMRENLDGSDHNLLGTCFVQSTSRLVTIAYRAVKEAAQKDAVSDDRK